MIRTLSKTKLLLNKLRFFQGGWNMNFSEMLFSTKTHTDFVFFVFVNKKSGWFFNQLLENPLKCWVFVHVSPLHPAFLGGSFRATGSYGGVPHHLRGRGRPGVKMFRCLKRLKKTEIRLVVPPQMYCKLYFFWICVIVWCTTYDRIELESSGKASIDLVLRPLLEYWIRVLPWTVS